jgi:hypothetical protein
MAHASADCFARTTRLALGGLASLSLVACYAHDDWYYDEPHSGTYFMEEIEPNNAAGQADYVGFLEPGETFVISGSVAGFNGIGPDAVDGFELSSPGGTHVSFYLDSVDPFSDVDVCLYDPWFGDYVACWESPFADEAGEFSVEGFGSDYQLVVIAADAATAYTLTIQATGYFYASADEGAKGASTSSLRTAQAPSFEKLEAAGLSEILDGYRAEPRALGARAQEGADAKSAEPAVELDAEGAATLER